MALDKGYCGVLDDGLETYQNDVLRTAVAYLFSSSEYRALTSWASFLGLGGCARAVLASLTCATGAASMRFFKRVWKVSSGRRRLTGHCERMRA